MTKESFKRFKTQEQIRLKRLEKDYNVLVDCLSWKRAFKRMNAYRKHPSVFIVNYTDIITDSQATLKKIYSFLHLGFEEKTLDLKWNNSSTFEETKNTGIISSRLNKYLDILTPKELGQISWICRDEIGMMNEPTYAFKTQDIFLLFINGLVGFFRRIWKRFRLFTFTEFLAKSRNYISRFH